jgi:hypothetical protein
LGEQISRDDQKQFNGNPTAMTKEFLSENHEGMNKKDENGSNELPEVEFGVPVPGKCV